MKLENQNSVCFLATITEIKPILGADKIEHVIVDTYNCVSQKGLYKVGQLVICCATEAVIPLELAEKLQVVNYLRGGKRVRTVKLKGIYSECLLINPSQVNVYGGKEGQDLMETLKIFKYEPPTREIFVPKIPKVYFKWKEIYKYKMWQSYINYLIHNTRNQFKNNYTDNSSFSIYHKFPNAKNVNSMFIEKDYVIITRKIHGCNARFGVVKKNKLSWKDKIKNYFSKDEWVDYEYVYGSHRVEKGSDSQGYCSTDVWKEIADNYDIRNKLWKIVRNSNKQTVGKGIIIYGEIYGEGIQGEKYNYGLNKKELAIFDIETDGIYASDMGFHLINSVLKLPVVPELYRGLWSKEIEDKFITNQFIEGTKIPHEGIVVKGISGDRSEVYKVINPDYLIFSDKNNIPDSH